MFSFYFRILDILAYIVKVNSDAMNRLYKLGAFEILLWKLLAGDLTDADKSSIVGLIRQSHLLQVIGNHICTYIPVFYDLLSKGLHYAFHVFMYIR